MLEALQQQLAEVYRVDATHDVRDYLVTDPVVASILSGDASFRNNDETLLVAEDDDGVAMSLFLDQDMLERLEYDNPLTRLHLDHLDDFWKVLEGVSHFNCMAWKAHRDRSVSLLELELQGEIDKFVGSLLLADGQANHAMLDAMHALLFEAASLRDDLEADERDRYAAASRYASRYCHRIQREWRETGTLPLDELREFFRLQFADKISRIHAHAWGNA